jgi:hypothetical protein
MWMGLVILAIFDDKRYWRPHIFGLTFLILAALLISFSRGIPNLILCLLATFIYVVASIAKIIIVMMVEIDLNKGYLLLFLVLWS